MLELPKSERAFRRAREIIPGGVNSPVRAYGAVGGQPPFISRGSGAYIYDLDNNEYIDYVLSWGPLILGHSHPAVVEAVKRAAERGTSFGAPTEAEVKLAEIVRARMPHIEMLRLVNSGTEAVMTAARLARASTGKEIILKFDGCYHGHSDGFLVEAGSGLATGGLPASRGIPASTTNYTISLPYNDPESVEKLFKDRGSQIAAVIVEPIAANMGVVLPKEDFLEALREITKQNDALLIFDEVITGFRVARGGATELFGVVPDLVCLGKILGGGLPIGAVGGKKLIMEKLAPSGDVYQAGTLSGNPISVTAGIATLKELDNPQIYKTLSVTTNRLAEGIRESFSKTKIPVRVNSAPGMLTLFFSDQKVDNFSTAKRSDQERFRGMFHAMLDRKIYLPPSPFEAWFLSIVHDDLIIGTTFEKLREVSNRIM